MAKLTLLDMVQDILSDLTSDEVNSVHDTVEAEQVANIVRDVYRDLTSSREYAFSRGIFQLEGLGDTSQPTKMKIPENISKVDEVKYDRIQSGGSRKLYTTIQYLTPQEFFDLVDARDESGSTVDEIVDSSGVLINIINNVPPTYYTTFDDEYIVFDSYDSAVDTTLQESKTKCRGVIEPVFTSSEPDAWATSTVYVLGDIVQNSSNVYKATSGGTSGGTAPTHTSGTVSDGGVDWIYLSSLTNYYDDYFIPDLPSKLFPLLLAEAKSTCFVRIKQMSDLKAEQMARRLRIHLRMENWRVEDGEPRAHGNVNYGRK